MFEKQIYVFLAHKAPLMSPQRHRFHISCELLIYRPLIGKWGGFKVCLVVINEAHNLWFILRKN